MAHTKCLFAIVFLACQVQAQASVEVQSGALLLVTLDQIQPGHQTLVSPDSNSTGTCQLIEVAARAGTCDGQNSGRNVKITISRDPLSSTGFSRWSPGHPFRQSLGDNVLLSLDNGGLNDLAGASDSYAFTCEQFNC